MRSLCLCLWLLVICNFAPLLCGQTISEQYLLAAANQDRAQHQLAPLRPDEHLIVAARVHALEMAKRRTISHRFEGEADLADRVAQSGAHFSLVTENVAEASTAALIHELWMRSAGHRANLLDPAVDTVGIAVVQFHGQLYAVEDFSRSVILIPIPQQEASVAALLKQQGLTILSDHADARQTCEMNTGFAGNLQPWFVMRYTSSDIRRLPEELTARSASGRYHRAAVGACVSGKDSAFSSYHLAVLLFP